MTQLTPAFTKHPTWLGSVRLGLRFLIGWKCAFQTF